MPISADAVKRRILFYCHFGYSGRSEGICDKVKNIRGNRTHDVSNKFGIPADKIGPKLVKENLLRSRGTWLFFAKRKRSRKNERDSQIAVAMPAPSIPKCMMKINRGSENMFNSAPNAIPIIDSLARPRNLSLGQRHSPCSRGGWL